MNAIVSKDSIKRMLLNSNPFYVEAVIGRALSAIYNNQTDQEQCNLNTKEKNDIGFSAFDAKTGSKCAIFYKNHNRLQAWMIEKWMKKDKNGYPRLCKYHSQLNNIAIKKS